MSGLQGLALFWAGVEVPLGTLVELSLSGGHFLFEGHRTRESG